MDFLGLVNWVLWFTPTLMRPDPGSQGGLPGWHSGMRDLRGEGGWLSCAKSCLIIQIVFLRWSQNLNKLDSLVQFRLAKKRNTAAWPLTPQRHPLVHPALPALMAWPKDGPLSEGLHRSASSADSPKRSLAWPSRASVQKVSTWR